MFRGIAQYRSLSEMSRSYLWLIKIVCIFEFTAVTPPIEVLYLTACQFKSKFLSLLHVTIIIPFLQSDVTHSFYNIRSKSSLRQGEEKSRQPDNHRQMHAILSLE